MSQGHMCLPHTLSRRQRPGQAEGLLLQLDTKAHSLPQRWPPDKAGTFQRG